MLRHRMNLIKQGVVPDSPEHSMKMVVSAYKPYTTCRGEPSAPALRGINRPQARLVAEHALWYCLRRGSTLIAAN